jgi:hypothetical protein
MADFIGSTKSTESVAVFGLGVKVWGRDSLEKTANGCLSKALDKMAVFV